MPSRLSPNLQRPKLILYLNNLKLNKEEDMDCPYCNSNDIKIFKTKTNLGYLQYFCRDCCHQYNERTGTKFNFIELPNEVVMLAVYYYYKFKVSLDNVVELMAIRGLYLSHQTVHNWVQTFGVEIGMKLRTRRKGQSGNKWHTDATYVKIPANWCYLYRAIDREGNLVDVYLSDTRDQVAAENFFKQAKVTTNITPIQITTDKEPALYPAINNVFPDVKHRDSKYKNNIIEQNHRGIKSRYKVMKGFKSLVFRSRDPGSYCG
ncbi:MAG: IS6 family transposase [Francisellaceae bacterium]|nr:IS6 family transposase [Francisellaceae bacterium]